MSKGHRVRPTQGSCISHTEERLVLASRQGLSVAAQREGREAWGPRNAETWSHLGNHQSQEWTREQGLRTPPGHRNPPGLRPLQGTGPPPGLRTPRTPQGSGTPRHTPRAQALPPPPGLRTPPGGTSAFSHSRSLAVVTQSPGDRDRTWWASQPCNLGCLGPKMLLCGWGQSRSPERCTPPWLASPRQTRKSLLSRLRDRKPCPPPLSSGSSGLTFVFLLQTPAHLCHVGSGSPRATVCPPCPVQCRALCIPPSWLFSWHLPP